ncbi:MAG: GtrA family protein [Amphiplicatus sp.]
MQALRARGKALIERHAAQAARFGVVGVLCAVTDFGLFFVLVEAGAPPVAANIVSFIAANIQGYALNARFAFRRGEEGHALSLGGYFKFFTAYAVSLALSTLVVGLLAPRIGPLPAKILATVLAGLWNYLASHFLIFREKGGGAESR